MQKKLLDFTSPFSYFLTLIIPFGKALEFIKPKFTQTLATDSKNEMNH